MGEIVWNSVLLADRWEAARSALGLDAETGAGIALYVAWGFLNGFVIIGLYGAIRPRMGPGPRTALVAGTFAWGLSSLGVAVVFQAAALFPASLIWTVVVGEAVIFALASYAGARVYREAPAVRSDRRASVA